MPRSRAASICAATDGAMRWRWISHQDRRWRRNRRLSAGASSCHSSCVWGRSASTTERQSNPWAAARRASRRTARQSDASERRSSASSRRPSQRGAAPCACGSRPRRESAMIGPSKPLSSSARQTSIMVSPLPISSTGRPGSRSRTASSMPRIAEVAGRLAVVRRKIAERQDGGIHPVGAPARGLEQQAVFERAKRRRLVGNQVQVATTPQPRDRVLEEMLDIGAIDLAAHEGAGEATLARGLPLCLRERCQPAHEMVGLVGERAHVLDAHVQQMARVCGRIGSALAQPRRTLDEVDPIVPAAAPQQMQGHEHAAEARPRSRRSGSRCRPSARDRGSRGRPPREAARPARGGALERRDPSLLTPVASLQDQARGKARSVDSIGERRPGLPRLGL